MNGKIGRNAGRTVSPLDNPAVRDALASLFCGRPLSAAMRAAFETDYAAAGIDAADYAEGLSFYGAGMDGQERQDAPYYYLAESAPSSVVFDYDAPADVRAAANAARRAEYEAHAATFKAADR